MFLEKILKIFQMTKYGEIECEISAISTLKMNFVIVLDIRGRT